MVRKSLSAHRRSRLNATTHISQKIMHSLIACSLNAQFIAFACGSELKIFDCKTSSYVMLPVAILPIDILEEKSLETDEQSKTKKKKKKSKGPSQHHPVSFVIRVLQFNEDSSMLMVSGEDKTVTVWRTSDWTRAASKELNKKITCGSFAPGGQSLLVGDKFGDVYSLSLPS